jgi:hypothetical protein
MNIIVSDLAARRSAAALKAWETRRAQGWSPSVQEKDGSAHETGASLHAEALEAFEREAASAAPDWHAAALALRAALSANQIKRPTQIEQKTKALLAPAWQDYPVDRVSSFRLLNPTIVVTFADGEVVRAPAVSIRGRPLNIGRGLRVAIGFYQSRMAWRAGVPNRPGFWPAVPAIALCVREDTGETFDSQQCSVRTDETRRAQDRRLK